MTDTDLHSAFTIARQSIKMLMLHTKPRNNSISKNLHSLKETKANPFSEIKSSRISI